jgi:2,4-dienoyl-CoA reductase-like NADH-dependent reductase (Old Yellow Enzyme family)
MTTPHLFDPITLRSLTIPHRLWVAPMCQYSANEGVPNAWHRTHLGQYAIGRAGLVITEATAVSPEGRISPGCTGIWNTEQQQAWEPITAFSQSQGVPIAIQLAHAGRKAATRIPWQDGPTALDDSEGGWDTVAPSALAFGNLHPPHEMAVADITTLVQDFGEAAKRSVAAGFDAIEIHAAHGYLLHEFLSQLSNHRTDAYGGVFDNRIKVVLEVIDAVRSSIPDSMPLFVRISATDWVEGGWSLEESIELSKAMEQHGVDFIDVSSGGLDPGQAIELQPGYQMPFAKAIKEHVSVGVGTVGLITSAQQAQEALEGSVADVVLMARQFLREPHFALRAAEELGREIAWPGQYVRAKPARS